MDPINPDNCPVEATLGVLAGKWKPLILHHLCRGTRRFNQLRRLLPAASPQMLTAHLRELERNGIVRREVYAEVPPRVEYSLTDLGRSLETVAGALAKWGRDYQKLRAGRVD